MKKTICMIAMATILFAFGCSKSDTEPIVQDLTMEKGQFKSDLAIPFKILQNVLIGVVNVSNDGTNIYVNATIDGWEFKENHIYVGTTAPTNHNPTQFPYIGTVTSPTTIEFQVSLSDLGDDCGEFFVAFHAKVKQPNTGSEHGWALAQSPFALYWYNSGGNQIGWGAYFAYNINCSSNIFMEEAFAPLSEVNAKARYRNFITNQSSIDPEVYLWPNAGQSDTAEFNFASGHYRPDLQENHIKLVFTPYTVVGGNAKALITCRTLASSTYDFAIDATPTLNFNTIQLVLLRTNVIDEFELRNIKINGVSIGDDVLIGRYPANRYNIYGDLLAGPGICQFEADLKIYSDASLDDNYIEISFGKY